MTIRSGFVKLLAVTALTVAPSMASAQSWTDWTSSGPGNVSGTLLGSAVTFTGGNIDAQLFNGTGFSTINYFLPSAPYTQGGLFAPGLGLIRFNGPSSNTITFATPVINPYFAFVSVGQPSAPVTYDFFSNSFSVLSNNDRSHCAYWDLTIPCANLPVPTFSVSGNALTGSEFSGTIQFIGTFSSISFTTDPGEDWHGITVGADSVVPEPVTMSLLAMGLVGMAAARRRGKRSA